jgi:3-isopropylmalate dehydratase small subunit
MVLTGHALRIAGELAPAQVIDPAIAASGDPAELAAACLAAVDPTLAERAREGNVLVLDGTLAAGAGAEAAVIALQAVGFAAVICRAVAPELRELGTIYGLPLLVAPDAVAVGEGELVRIDLERGRIEAGGRGWPAPPLAPDALAAVRRGQLLARMRRVVEDEGFAE